MQYPIIDLITSAYINNGWTGLDIITGKNLFNKDAIIDNSWIYINSTYVAPSDGYCVSDFIEIRNGNPVYIPLKGSARNALYDINKNGVTYLAFSGGVYTPNIDGYIRVTINKQTVDINSYQIEYGTVPTPYEPYSEPKNDFPNRLKLPLPHYFPHPVIDSLKRASDGTMTNKDREILTHYLTPLGIGGI